MQKILVLSFLVLLFVTTQQQEQQQQVPKELIGTFYQTSQVKLLDQEGTAPLCRIENFWANGTWEAMEHFDGDCVTVMKQDGQFDREFVENIVDYECQGTGKGKFYTNTTEDEFGYPEYYTCVLFERKDRMLFLAVGPHYYEFEMEICPPHVTAEPSNDDTVDFTFVGETCQQTTPLCQAATLQDLTCN